MGLYIMLISCCTGSLHKQKGHRSVCEVRFVVSVYQDILQYWISFAQEKSHLHKMDTLHNHLHDLLPPCTFLYSDFIINYSCGQPKPTCFAAMGIPIWDMTGMLLKGWICWKTSI